jgi:hypothetical protein
MADACACGEGDCHALWMAIKNKECDKIFQDMGDGEGDMIGRCSNELISKGHRGGQVFADKLRAKIKKECDKRKEKP